MEPKRLAVIAGSIVLGTVISVLIVMLIQLTMQKNVTIAYYGYDYFALTALFVSATVLVWVDKFAGTNILPK